MEARRFFVAILILAVYGGYCANAEYVFSAFARLYPTLQGASLFSQGYVRFDQISVTDKRVNVTVNIQGSLVNQGTYGMIIHQYGDITDKQAGATLGGHFVGSGNATHGCPSNPGGGRHEGDLGNWQSQGGGISSWQIMPADYAALALHPPNEIIGLGVALHSNTDSCSGTDGGVGAVIAMGTIGIMNIDNNDAEYDSMTTTTAVASLAPTSLCTACSGTVWFTQTAVGVLVEAQVFGMGPTGAHGFNIHYFGDLSGVADAQVGDHFNPYGRLHNLPPALPRHMGDLGSIQDFSPSTSSSWYRYETANIPNVRVIIGRAIVVSAQPDYGVGIGCPQDGNEGAAFALGVIGVANPATVAPSLPSDVNPQNKWTSLNCTVPNNVPANSGQGEMIFLIIGWALAAFFLCFAVGLIIYYYKKLRGRAGYEDLP